MTVRVATNTASNKQFSAERKKERYCIQRKGYVLCFHVDGDGMRSWLTATSAPAVVFDA